MIKSLLHFSGKKLYLLAFILGCFSALAFAPVFMAVLLIPTFSMLLALVENQKHAKKAFFVGWWFGFGHFIVGLYWIAIALLVDGSQFYWLIPFAVAGIPFLLSFYPALVCYLSYRLFQAGYTRWLGFCSLWVISEFARAYLFSGFPWNLLGYSLAFSDELLQLASIFGVYGLSLVVVIVSTSLYFLLCDCKIKTSRRLPFLLSLLMLLVVWLFGFFRIYGEESGFVQNVRLRIVQGGIEQSLKWNPERSQDIVQHHINMTVSEGIDDITHVIWPESALPYAVTNDSVFFKVLAPMIPRNGALITGVVRTEESPFGFKEKLWNSIEVIDDKGRTASFYDKHHLVPFGEYIPFRNLFPFAVQKITSGSTDFSRGVGPRTITVPGMPSISPLICYEAIFPRHAVAEKERPQLLVNITNDAWYGRSSGPYQHFHTVRVRAIEQGIPLVRAANTGISAVIDSYGRIQDRTQLGMAAILDVKLPLPLNGTPYGRLKNIPVQLLVFFLLFFCFFRKKV